MTFSEDWENTYKKSNHLSVWPWSDLVSYVMRYIPLQANSNVLELGCGAGANIPFFEKLGVNYYAIEGSKTMVELLKVKYPKYSDNIFVGDFTSDIPFDLNFDLIIDRASLTHNKTNDINRAVNIIHKKLFTNGFFVGIDWFSTEHSEYIKGSNTDDKYTKNNFISGPFSGVGNVHFSDKSHILELFNNFNIQVLEHKKNEFMIPNETDKFATWNFVAKKL